MLMSAVSAENFDSIYHQKGIITAFKEAGFKTANFLNAYDIIHLLEEQQVDASMLYTSDHGKISSMMADTCFFMHPPVPS